MIATTPAVDCGADPHRYDTLGQVREIDDPDAMPTTATYDLAGNIDVVTNGRGRITVSAR